jgi:DnaK suppressor protein
MTAKRSTTQKGSTAGKKAATSVKSSAKAPAKKPKAAKKAPVRKVAEPVRAKKVVKPAPKSAVRKVAEPKAAKPRSAGAARDRGKSAPARAKKPQRVVLDLPRFREQLLKKQKDLLQAYMSAKGDSRARQSDGTEDYIDYAVSSYDREFLLSLTELEQDQLMLVDEALRRIDRGGYGRCSQCDQPIPPKRLEVQPWARYCVRCQELEEQGLVQESPESLPDEDDPESVVEEEAEHEVGYDDDTDDIDDDEPADGIA